MHVLRPERENNHTLKAAWHANIVSAFVSRCFCVCGRQKPKDPKLSPMADDAITQGFIGSLVSPLYICGLKLGILLVMVALQIG